MSWQRVYREWHEGFLGLLQLTQKIPEKALAQSAGETLRHSIQE
jgi:hypothetical protein